MCLFPFSRFMLTKVLCLGIISLVIGDASASPSILVHSIKVAVDYYNSSNVFFGVHKMFDFDQMRTFIPTRPPVFPILVFVLPLGRETMPPTLFPVYVT